MPEKEIEIEKEIKKDGCIATVFFYCPFHPGSKPFRHQLPE